LNFLFGLKEEASLLFVAYLSAQRSGCQQEAPNADNDGYQIPIPHAAG
jgi:hypothetical protein